MTRRIAACCGVVTAALFAWACGPATITDLAEQLDGSDGEPASSGGVAFVRPAAGSTVAGTITLEVSSTTTMPDQVLFYLGHDEIGFDNDGAPWTWTVDTTALADARYTFKASAFAGGSRIGRATVRVTVKNAMPTPTPTPTATTTPTPAPMPSLSTFSTKIQPWMNGQGCGDCHNPATAGYLLYTGTPSAQQVESNWTYSKCVSRLSSYSAPSGRLLNYFCTNATTPNGGHKGRTATATVCGNLYAWALEGAGATPPACP